MKEGSSKGGEVVRDKVIIELAGYTKKIWTLLSSDGKPLNVLSRDLAFYKGGFVSVLGMVYEGCENGNRLVRWLQLLN